VLQSTNQLESLLLEAFDDLRDEVALNTVRLDHDEGTFTGHFLSNQINSEAAVTRELRLAIRKTVIP
jgi:hypothetical protein